MPPIIPPSPPPSTPQTATGSTWIKTGGATSGTVSALDYAYYEQTAKFKSSCKKIKQLPGGGPYTQRQKFEIYSIATDQDGTTYGTIPDASDGIVFGPRGKVFTSQPWIWQVPWDAARDVEYNVVTVGTSNGLQFSGLPWNGETRWSLGTDLGELYRYYMKEAPWPDWSQHDFFHSPFAQSDIYPMYGGGYNLSSEIGYASSSLGFQRMQQFIEDNVDRGLKSEFWQERHVVPLPIVSDGFSQPQQADRVVQDPYYSTTRHDYS